MDYKNSEAFVQFGSNKNPANKAKTKRVNTDQAPGHFASENP